MQNERCVLTAATALIAGALAVSTARAQMPRPLVGEEPVKVSDHVWAIMGFPNIGIIVGSQSVLVVDTGLGPKNGAAIVRVVQTLAPKHKMYLTTTHFHPEHASGEAAFPAGTVLIRNTVQEREVIDGGQSMIDLFSNRSSENRELLAGVRLRKPDVEFDSEYVLDLGGGVRVRLLWLGEAHTKGDELVFVDPDKTLISGDVVQNKTVPNIFGNGGTPASWIAVIDKVKPLGALHILPDHSPIGDGTLVVQDREFISQLRDRSLELKRQQVDVEAAGATLTAEFKAKYPDWNIKSVAGFVKSAYSEN